MLHVRRRVVTKVVRTCDPTPLLYKIGNKICLNCTKAKKRKCLVSGYPTDPNILGPTQTFFKTFRILKSIFRLF